MYFLLKNSKNNNAILVTSIQYFTYPKEWTNIMNFDDNSDFIATAVIR